MVKLSVIIPYYKTYELTINLLEKLIPQLTNEVEVFLVDDGCNETRLDKYNTNIQIIHLEKNSGDSVARNVAIKKAIGKYIAFIDSDDMIVDDYIETLINTINEHNEELIYLDWQDMHSKEIVHNPSNYAPWRSIYRKDIVPLFDENIRYSSDVPFQDEIEKTPRTRYYIGKVLYIYNSNREGSLTLEKAKLIKENEI